MASIDEIRGFGSTAQRRRNLYCFATTKFIQDQIMFFMLVEVFRAERKKRQAQFIKDWFIDGNIPDNLQDQGYMSIANFGKVQARENSVQVTAAIAAIGKTFSDKIQNRGGGLSGFFGALGAAIGGNTSLSGDLFDKPQQTVAEMWKPSEPFSAFRPDNTYQANGTFAVQVLLLKKALKENGFDPDDLGVF